MSAPHILGYSGSPAITSLCTGDAQGFTLSIGVWINCHLKPLSFNPHDQQVLLLPCNSSLMLEVVF